jgi:prepilin-type N-terminal cleavage/methylation domain-containing protein
MRDRPIAIAARRRSGAATAPAAGFTLVEMLVVLVMLGIVGRMAIPHIDFDRYRADAAGRMARVILQSAQRNAILRQSNVIVSFDASRGALVVLEDANNNGVVDGGERMVVKALADGARLAAPPAALSGCGANAVNGGSLSLVGSLPAISFLRDGAASSDLCVYLTAGNGAPENFRAIRLTQATGRAEYWKYSGSSWFPGGV